MTGAAERAGFSLLGTVLWVFFGCWGVPGHWGHFADKRSLPDGCECGLMVCSWGVWLGVLSWGCDHMEVPRLSWGLTQEMLRNGVCKDLHTLGESFNPNLLRSVCTCVQA